MYLLELFRRSTLVRLVALQSKGRWFDLPHLQVIQMNINNDLVVSVTLNPNTRLFIETILIGVILMSTHNINFCRETRHIRLTLK